LAPVSFPPPPSTLTVFPHYFLRFPSFGKTSIPTRPPSPAPPFPCYSFPPDIGPFHARSQRRSTWAEFCYPSCSQIHPLDPYDSSTYLLSWIPAIFWTSAVNAKGLSLLLLPHFFIHRHTNGSFFYFTSFYLLLGPFQTKPHPRPASLSQFP